LRDFIHGVIQNYFGEIGLEELEFVEEVPQGESEDFLQFF
jgi:hypothetical protein